MHIEVGDARRVLANDAHLLSSAKTPSPPKSRSGNVPQRGNLSVHAGIATPSGGDALPPDFVLGRLRPSQVRCPRGPLPRLPGCGEISFLRKQLALFQERKVKPRRAGDATRWLMATLGHMFRWRNCAAECEAGYAHPLATQRIPVLLARTVAAVSAAPRVIG